MLPIEVKGLPPNKSVKGSMWSNKDQAARLIELRKEALRCLGRKMLTGRVRLTLEVHVGIPGWDTLDADDRRKALRRSGDLDNLITGVSDGLMAAHANLLRAKTWHKDFDIDTESDKIHPEKPIAYEDDSQIVEICANKVVTDTASGEACWYRVTLEDLGALR